MTAAALAALCLLFVACDEEEAGPLAAGGSGGEGGAAGAGGAGGLGGSGGAGGAGGEPWPAHIRVWGSCDPTHLTPHCKEGDSVRCIERDGVWWFAAEDCSDVGVSCDPWTGRCADELLGWCSRSCTIGKRTCFSDDPTTLMSCVHETFNPPDNSGPIDCPGTRPLQNCARDEVCREGACVPSCEDKECDCPEALEPACADDGRLYWNACYLACAGRQVGVGCQSQLWEKVWTPPVEALGLLPIGPGLFLTNLAQNPSPSTPNLAQAMRLSTPTLGPETTAEVVWEERLGDVLRGVSLPLEGGKRLVLTDGFETAWAVVGESGVEALTSYPADGLSPRSQPMLREGDRVWLHDTGHLLYLTLPDITGPNAASGPYPAQEEDWAGPATFGRDGRDGTPLLITVGGYRSTVWRLDTTIGTRSYEGPFKQDFSIDTVSAVSTDEGVEVVQQGSGMASPSGGMLLRQVRWDGSCARERARFASFGAGGYAGYGDLDGDGDEDVAWAVGTEVLVLERNEGWLTLAARIPLEAEFGGLVTAEASIGDLDGDGRAELWVSTNTVWPGSTPANVVFRRVP